MKFLSKFYKQLGLWTKNEQTKIVSIFVIFYSILLSFFSSPGQFWDWAFPYFKGHLPNYFLSESMSWTEQNLGQPMSYSANYPFRFFVWVFTSIFKILPEHFLFILFVSIFTLGTFGAYKIIKPGLQKTFKNDHLCIALSILLGISVFLNPAIFYKFLAGHLYYFISYVIFIWLIYFLLNKFKKDIKSHIILGLFLALAGIQLQFFFFSAIMILIYFFVFREKFSLKGTLISLLIILGINLPWLTNFILGVSSVAGASQIASSGAFPELMQANPIWIALMIFSKATMIKDFYPKIIFVFFGLFTLALGGFFVYRVLIKKQYDKTVTFLAVCLFAFFLLGTGFFHKFQIRPFNLFYPMLREVGHIAPLIILFELLLFAVIVPKLKRLNWLIALYFVIFISINGHVFVNYVPRVDYTNARAEFKEFDTLNSSDQSSYRILTYPFWYQYGFKNEQNKYANGVLVNNSGWDSFIKFSGKDYIDNSLNVADITQNLQYRLLKNPDVSELEKLNIKYIYDFSKIYESNYELYSAPSVYQNNISLIKNDSEFMNKIIESNPGRIIKISDTIFKLNNVLPRVYSENNNKIWFQKISPTKYKVRVDQLDEKATLNFLENHNKGWSLRLNKITVTQPNTLPSWCKNKQTENNNSNECFASQNSIEKILPEGKSLTAEHNKTENGFNSWIVDPTKIKTNYNNEYYTTNEDGSINIDLEIYFKPQTYFGLAVLVAILTASSSLTFIMVLNRKKAS